MISDDKDYAPDEDFIEAVEEASGDEADDDVRAGEARPNKKAQL